MSSGREQAKFITPYDGLVQLTNAVSIEFFLAPGITDIGAYEFRGSSSDVLPPTVSSTLPTVVQESGATTSTFDEIEITFSEEINNLDALSRATYELRNNGPNGQFGDSDDVIYVVTPVYSLGDARVSLQIVSGVLPVGSYRLTVFGQASRGIHDTAGWALDGDANGMAGGDYIRFFTIKSTVPAVAGDFDHSGLVDQADHAFWKQHFGATSGVGLQADANRDGVVDAADYLVWRKNVGATGSSAPGDFDRSGNIDQGDHTFWKQHFGDTSGVGLQADANSNGVVDTADYIIWRKARPNAMSSSIGSASSSEMLPEAEYMNQGATSSTVREAIFPGLSLEVPEASVAGVRSRARRPWSNLHVNNHSPIIESPPVLFTKLKPAIALVDHITPDHFDAALADDDLLNQSAIRDAVSVRSRRRRESSVGPP
jgi:hypothetical protein